MSYIIKEGTRVKNVNGEEGVILKVDDRHIKVDYNGRTAILLNESKTFVKPYLTLVDENEQQVLNSKLIDWQKEERIAEEAKEKAEEDKKTEETKKNTERLVKEKAEREKKEFESKFDKDYHVQHLSRKSKCSYSDIENDYGIVILGFGRGINITNNSIILISSIEKKGGSFVYHDHWTENGDYIYSGEGKIGDQQMTKGNKAIVDAKRDGKELYLFIKFSSQEYYFQGKFELVDYTYEDDKDENGNIRKEYKFKLRKITV